MPFTHRTQINILRRINVADVQPGQIIQFRYDHKDPAKRDSNNRIVLVLTDNDDSGRLHGLDLSHMTDREVFETCEAISYSLPDAARESFVENLPVIYLNMDDLGEGSLRSIYENRIKSFSYNENPYRTFLRDNMAPIYLSEFRVEHYR